MNRWGFALLTVLWLLVTLTAVGAAALAVARLGAGASRNRIALMRGAWAREACAEILLARYPQRGVVAGLDTTDLGRGTWCRATVEDASARLDLNRAPREILRALLGSDSLTDALLDWRDSDGAPRENGAEAEWYRAQGRRLPRNGPLADVAELGFVRGFDGARMAALRPDVTVRGAGQIDVNAAAPAVLATLPAFGAEAVGLVVRRRERGLPVRSGDELLSLLSPSARQTLLSRYQDYSLQAGYSPLRVVVRIEGGVRGAAPVSAARLTVVPLPERLAVIRREVE
ncbi:MAG: general secretion pathway protein GspK [Gemmatimonadales bacterium]